ncbi:MAG: electron transport complex subunit RsxC [Treponema sp.]|jgi:electron transport complex protein RnfC|nr:electron transport complex subunit RsxC [Treponema sp.]
MTVHTFKRGIKLNPRKHATEGKAIEIAPLPKQVVIPVNQHFGAPNKSIVNAGDRVKRGQKIAEGAAPGPMTAPVHASVSGVVKKIEPRILANNTEGLCVVIEADGGDDTCFMPPLDPFSCSKEEALERIRDAGMIGMGGAGFPSHVKFNPPSGKTINLIIANGAECEPYLTIDEAVMTEKTGLLVKGLAIVMKITGVKKAIIGIEDNKSSLIPVLLKEIEQGGYPGEISLGLCKTRYPQGGEKILITALTGREVPSGGLPLDVGCIVSNVGTLASIAEAFTLGKPLIDRNLTISGAACKTPKNICVPVGTILGELPPEFLGIDDTRLRKIVFGGPMMGFAVPSLNVPVQKNTSGILLLANEELFAGEEGACIRCGNCIRNCSCRLSPVVINNALEAADLDEALKAGLNDCVECGCCSYVCTAKLKLTQRFRAGKQRLRMKHLASQEAARVAAEQAKRMAENFKAES